MNEQKSKFSAIVMPSLVSVVGIVLMLVVGYFVVTFILSLLE